MSLVGQPWHGSINVLVSQRNQHRYAHFWQRRPTAHTTTTAALCHVFSAAGTHQVAEANQQKNDKLRMAFGISEYFVDGSSLDPQRQAKETEAKALAMAQKQYE